MAAVAGTLHLGGSAETCSDVDVGRVLDARWMVGPHLPFVSTYRSEDGWDALGDRTRRAIIGYLAERPQAVGELAQRLPVSRPAVSQHLKVLKDAGLVIEHAAGTRRIYRLNPSGVSALRDQLDVFWTRALASYKDVVEQPTEERS
jgi:DNA-binding transcriptional ArsR family regulator